MGLETKHIKKIAQLAQLAINDQQTAILHKDLTKILQLVEHTNAVNIDNVEPLAHPLDEKQPLRDDVATETDQRAIFQTIAPLVENHCYLVPKVLDNE